MMKTLTILALISPMLAYGDVILISDNRSIHAEGLENATPFNVTKTPSAPFADFSDTALGGSLFGSAFAQQASSFSPTEFSLAANSLGLFTVPGGNTVQYKLVDTYDVTFQVTTPTPFILTASGNAFDFGNTPTHTLIGNLQKDAVPFLLPVDRSIGPLDPISLSGMLDPGLYHISLQHTLEGSGEGLIHGQGFFVANLKFVPDGGSSAMLLGLGLLAFPCLLPRRIH